RTKANVVLAFFGYNESFAGKSGLPKFKEDLTAFVQQTLQHKYDGINPARLVLFAPIAHENLHDPNLPDGGSDNENLKIYAAAIGEVATQTGVLFVDLFSQSQELYRKASKPLTSDGVHLNASGHRAIAEVIFRALCPTEKPAALSASQLEKL